MNVVVIDGFLVREPTLETIDNSPLCKIAITHVDNWKYRKHYNWINVQAWGENAEFAKKYFKKGDPIMVKGKLKCLEIPMKGLAKKMFYYYIDADTVEFGRQQYASYKDPFIKGLKKSKEDNKPKEDKKPDNDNGLDLMEDEEMGY